MYDPFLVSGFSLFCFLFMLTVFIHVNRLIREFNHKVHEV